MNKRYLVLGAGQGEAVAYRLAQYPDTEEVLLVDRDAARCMNAANRIELLLGNKKVIPAFVDVLDRESMVSLLRGKKPNAIVGATTFKMNEYLTDLAIEFGSNFVDMGGNTGVVWAQHKREERARKAGISIVPDTGMGPGFNLSLANAVAHKLGEPRTIRIYCGGLPIKPEGGLNYALFFSIEGLVNEYTGLADLLRDGKLAKRPTIADIERKFLPRVGELEAANTSGGVSTAPWTYLAEFPTLKEFSYKTLRYPGHWRAIAKWKKRGGRALLRQELVKRLGETVSRVPDLGIIRVEGESVNGKRIAFEVLDRCDPEGTGFSAMQRLTGFHSAVVAYLAAHYALMPGVIPVECIPGEMIIREMTRCGVVTEAFDL